jgi:hypothetical protein
MESKTRNELQNQRLANVSKYLAAPAAGEISSHGAAAMDPAETKGNATSTTGT